MTRRKRVMNEVSFQITPMIDLTFLLLMFFMVTQRITEQQMSVPVNLPMAVSATPPEPTIRDTINLDGAGQYYIGDRVASLEEVRAHLKVMFHEYPPLQIYLRADSRTPSRLIREFVDAAAEVGAIDLIFGVHGE